MRIKNLIYDVFEKASKVLGEKLPLCLECTNKTIKMLELSTSENLRYLTKIFDCPDRSDFRELQVYQSRLAEIEVFVNTKTLDDLSLIHNQVRDPFLMLQ
jgi:hypothetical protein